VLIPHAKRGKMARNEKKRRPNKREIALVVEGASLLISEGGKKVEREEEGGAPRGKGAGGVADLVNVQRRSRRGKKQESIGNEGQGEQVSWVLIERKAGNPCSRKKKKTKKKGGG